MAELQRTDVRAGSSAAAAAGRARAVPTAAVRRVELHMTRLPFAHEPTNALAALKLRRRRRKEELTLTSSVLHALERQTPCPHARTMPRRRTRRNVPNRSASWHSQRSKIAANRQRSVGGATRRCSGPEPPRGCSVGATHSLARALLLGPAWGTCASPDALRRDYAGALSPRVSRRRQDVASLPLCLCTARLPNFRRSELDFACLVHSEVRVCMDKRSYARAGP